MVADTYDSFLGIILQGTGNNNNTWGTTFNNSAAIPLARSIAGKNIISATGGVVDLSTVVPPAGLRADVDMIQIANGALTSDLTIKVPVISKMWWFWNNTTGNFNMFVAAGSATTVPGLVQIPQGAAILVMGDGSGTLLRHDDSQIGSFCLSGKAAVGPGELACNGASLLKAEYPNLFGKIGTTWGSVDSLHFTLPNFTDTARFLRSSSGSLAVGTYQSNQAGPHTHPITGAPAVGALVTDSQGAHVHGVTDPGHTHTFPLIGNVGNQPFAAAGTSTSSGSGTTNSSFTGISINSAGVHTHNVTGSLTAGSLGTANPAGSETRPETAVILMGIRY